MQQKWEFLREKGMPDNDILEALNEATGDGVIRAAGIDWSRAGCSAPSAGAKKTARRNGAEQIR